MAFNPPAGASRADKNELRRRCILDAATFSFARDGLKGTSLGTISKLCGAAPSLILYHYKHIDRLFMEVVRELMQGASTILDRYQSTASEGRESLKAYVEGMFDWIAVDESRQSIATEFYHECRFKPEMRALHAEYVRLTTKRLEALIERGRAAGHFACVDVELAAVGVQDLVTGVLLKIASSHEAARVPRLRQMTYENALKIVGAK